MLPQAGEVLHFSEDPSITVFVPHIAATAQQTEPYVWAVDAITAPAYWFPRQCPRVCAWKTPTTTPDDEKRVLGSGVERVHAIEYRWLRSMLNADLFAYRLPAELFRPIGTPVPFAMVATEPVRPLGPPERVGDVLACHAEQGIQFRLLPDLAGFWEVVKSSTVGFSGIRLSNARSHLFP